MAKSDDLAQIVRGCKSGKTESFSQLIDMYSSRCYGYFYRLTSNRDSSDELLSELFVRLVEKIGGYKGGSFEGWLFRIATNLFHDHLRARQRQKAFLDARKKELATEVATGRRHEDERIDKIQMHLGRLDEDTRTLISLRFYSGLSFKELAKMRGEPIGTTLARLHRGLKKLREMME